MSDLKTHGWAIVPVAFFAAAALGSAPGSATPALGPVTPALHPAPLVAQETTAARQEPTTLIRAARMIDGKGSLVEPGAVLVSGDRITAAGAEAASARADHVIDLGDATILPGLIDLHTHLTDRVGTHWEEVLITTTPAQAALYGAANALTTLRAGFTTVRDMGPTWPYTDVDLRDVINAGVPPGPAHAGGRQLRLGDGRRGRRAPVFHLRGRADGAEPRRRGGRGEGRRGAPTTSTARTSPRSWPPARCCPGASRPARSSTRDGELAVAVEETNRWGRFTAAHAHGAEGIKAAIRAGVRTIDHGSMMDDEAIAMLQESDHTYFVPTLYVGVIVPRDGAALGVPEEQIRRSTEMMRYRNAAFRRAMEAGLPVGFATDAGVFEHGHNAREFQIRVENGQGEMDAITSATSISAMIMGWEADIGSLEAGKYADVIAVPGNPLEDITLLERVMWVMKGGEVYRD